MLPSVNELALLSILSRGGAREDTIRVISSEVNMFSHQRPQLERYHFPKEIYRLLPLHVKPNPHIHTNHITHTITHHKANSTFQMPPCYLSSDKCLSPACSSSILCCSFLFFFLLPSFFPFLFETGFRVSQTGLVLYVFEEDLKFIILPASTF